MKRVSDYTSDAFQELNRIINVMEHSAVNTVSAFAPWLAPIAPAVIAYNHLTTILLFNPLPALAVALVIEFIGISAVSTVLQFWKHNRKHGKINHVPILAPFFAAMFYLFVILSVNVLLELPEDWVPIGITKVLAITLISMLSIPAAVLLGSRSLYQDTLDTVQKERQERQDRSHSKLSGQLAVIDNRHSVNRPTVMTDISDMTAAEIVSQYNVSERTAYRWMAETKGKNGSKQ